MIEDKEEREALESQVGQVWNTDELCKEFDVFSFMAPYCFVRRKDTGQEGSLKFQHMPRFYYGWKADRE